MAQSHTVAPDGVLHLDTTDKYSYEEKTAAFSDLTSYTGKYTERLLRVAFCGSLISKEEYQQEMNFPV